MTREPHPPHQATLGNIPEKMSHDEYPRKYVIAKQGNQLVFHIGNDSSHKLVSRECGVEYDDVLGGGLITFKADRIFINEESMVFGGVPTDILELFVEQLKQHFSASEVILRPRSTEEDRLRFGLT